MARTSSIIVLAICLASTACYTASAAQTNDILLKIDQMASLGESAEPSLGESIADGIENNPTEISSALLPRLKDKSLTEMQLATYVWALGLAKNPSTKDAIIDVYRQTKSEWVQGNCLRALAAIGGKQSEDFLLSVLESTPAGELRFNILNLLCQIQCEQALPKTQEVLKLDIKNFYWRSIFVFGKMGDKSVPFLLSKIDDADRNVRANAINVLGQWLIPPEAAQPMFDHYWTENDKEIRSMILSSLESTVPDFSVMTKYFEQIVGKEKDEELLKFAQETLDGMSQMKAEVTTFAKSKKVSSASFQSEYARIFKSAGKEGDYEILTASSTIEDELKLEGLRERILQRDSDESFYDYKKINSIIMMNRLAKNMAGQKSVQQPPSPRTRSPERQTEP